MEKELLWRPTDNIRSESNINKYIKWLKTNKNLVFSNYDDLWNWSVLKYEDFWKSILEYFEVSFSGTFEKVSSGEKMWETRWFEGIKLNYAQHVFKNKNELFPAIIFSNESGKYEEISWNELENKVASLAHFLKSTGIKKGDTVCAYLPAIPEATIAFLAVNSLGAIWSSASPDFGVDSIVSRFAQIKPKFLIAADGYKYSGKSFDKMKDISAIADKIPEIENLLIIDYLGVRDSYDEISFMKYEDCVSISGHKLEFEQLDFNHPLWVLYSSGTTGLPKAITHSVGGSLIEHLKYLVFHNDVHFGERFFWFTTTGWMMWNYVQASFLAGATVVLFDGSPAYPDLNNLWRFANIAKINHFGTSAPFITACMKSGMEPGAEFNLQSLRSISSTGSPLPPAGFKWIYEHVKNDVWMVSMSGGTDVCTAFVGGNPTLNVNLGEIQCRALGASVYAFDDDGMEVYDEVGEMVITKPMPSMPIYFWNDKDNQRYINSYFQNYPNIWRHGDWLEIKSDTKGLIIYGRSDATLNRQGVRIGTAEIYRAIDMIDEIKDCLIVNLELKSGEHFMPLFVMLREELKLNEEIVQKIKNTLKNEYSPRHVPDEIIEVSDIPYTLSGKKMEEPVKKILLGKDLNSILNRDSIRNPQALNFFINYAVKVLSSKI